MPTRHTVDVDGQEVVAVHHEAGTGRWLFFSHGLVSDKSGSYVRRCERAVEEGYDAVRFDHRGCGESEGEFGETTVGRRVEGLAAVVDYFDPPSGALFGSSLGGRAAFGVAAEDTRVEGVATRAPVTYGRVLSKGGGSGFLDDPDGRRFEDVADGFDVPALVVHGRDDETVPLSGSLEAVGALDADATLVVYAGEGHRFSPEAEERTRDTVFGWLSGVL